MATAPSIATTYDILLYADADIRIGLERRWFILGSHRSRLDASVQFSEVSAEFPNEVVKVLMVASVHDEATGLFRDRIVQSRGLAPLIDRRQARRLTETDRRRLARATAPWQARRAAPKPPPRPAPAWIWWLAGLATATGTAAGYLIR